MYPLENRLTIMGRLDEIALARDFVASAAHNTGLSQQHIHHCTLAVDEICTNIIEHGYQLDGANKSIEIICRIDSVGLTITIRDKGPAFNPLARTDPDPTATLEERNDGGWGIFFTKEIMDNVVYTREGDHNQLTMSKKRISSV